jgi:NDP-sugar pyrophosphorylase family protein
MQKPTLLILAAGMASRYGGSLKQIQKFGPGGETIMDYSLFDAIRAGFGKVVFIIRKEFAEEFKGIFEPKLKGKVEVEYVFQELTDIPKGFSVPEGRSKPWGTAHAMLCARHKINEPFIVINADDFYGKDAFEKAFGFLDKQVSPSKYAIVGYELAKTLSDHGTVSRGVCTVDAHNHLTSITERTKIYPENGKIIYEDADGTKHEVPTDSKVSMNFWCFDPSVFEITEQQFSEFLRLHGGEAKSEFFIPLVADEFIRTGQGTVDLVPTSSQWFGVTYQEDAPFVKNSIEALVTKGEYPAKLWP